MAIGNAPVPQEIIAASIARLAGHQVEGFLLGHGKWPASIMFVGEAPGANEIREGIPFIGQAGKVLSGYLEGIGLSRDDLYISSAVRSRPYKEKVLQRGSDEPKISYSNRTPTKKEVLAHAPILDAEIAIVEPEIIVPLGNIALHRLIGSHETVSSLHGRTIEGPIQQLIDPSEPEKGYQFSEKIYRIFPMFHPAAVIYNRKLENVIQEDIQKLKVLLDAQ